ncbi:hypothetical protein NM688_g2484 [Phlebia brevispora]|uniref:Uncharacterized protein n=1 Tax=Phlebia brevispora TaxID=194682 RepID=A0ACC1T8C4_9APHY|nr:hypothetical protein NM688_g2484 [Phlebia brevispora]
MSEQIELSSPPFDSVSQVRFSPTNPSHLLVSSWDTRVRPALLVSSRMKGCGNHSDGVSRLPSLCWAKPTVRFYDVNANEQKAKFDHRAAVLTTCFGEGDHAYSGGLDTVVRQLDLYTEKIDNLGQHSDSISTMNFSKELNSVITGSWDRTVRFWDPRASNPQQQSHELPERVYYMDLVNHNLVVAMASRLFHIYDIRKMDAPAQTRESSLKFMTRALACMADGQGYATASVEGRIAVEYFDPSPEAQEKKYAFKCHRQTINTVDHVWPVNSLAFHPVYNTFASAGSDGTVSIWDHKLKKRLRQYPKYRAAVPSVAFNSDGTKLAIGVSYTWDEGEEGAKTAERPAVFIRSTGDEVKTSLREELEYKRLDDFFDAIMGVDGDKVLVLFFRSSQRSSSPVQDSDPRTSENEKDDIVKPEPATGNDEVWSVKGTRVEVTTEQESDLNPGELTFEEDTSGGLGRHLGVFTCTLLIVGRVIGTGVFSTPSSILGSVGSVGASMMLWVLGFVLSFCGLFIWLELGTMFPRSGGEKVYLEAMYQRPRHLATVFFAANAIILGFSASNCIVFASNILVSAGHEAGRWTTRGIAIGVISFCVLVHGLIPRAGIVIMNSLSVFKIVILLFVVITGWAVLAGHTKITDPHVNFRNAFADSSHSSNDYATAMFKVLFAYDGWSNINYVLNNVRDPIRTLKIAGPLGLGICTILYILANVAYFAGASKEEIEKSGVTVASLFLGKVFGSEAQKALTVFIALSALGNVLTVSFAAARINQELAKEGLPLPLGNRFWASNWPLKTPLPGLLLHWIPSIIVIIAPPPTIAYPFILDVQGYPQQIINLFVVLGLFWLRWKKPHIVRPFKIWLPLAVFFLAASVFLLVAPFIRPANRVGDTPPLPYYLYCLVGIAVMVFSIIYWGAWRVVLPWLFKYKLVPEKRVLKDGTWVTVYEHHKLE